MSTSVSRRSTLVFSPRLTMVFEGWQFPMKPSLVVNIYVSKLWNMKLHYFCFSPLGRAWPFIWRQLNPLQLGILCAKFGWNWHSGSGEEDFVKSCQFIFFIYLFISQFSPLGSAWLSFEQLWILLNQGYFVPSSVVLEKKIFFQL